MAHNKPTDCQLLLMITANRTSSLLAECKFDESSNTRRPPVLQNKHNAQEQYRKDGGRSQENEIETDAHRVVT